MKLMIRCGRGPAIEVTNALVPESKSEQVPRLKQDFKWVPHPVLARSIISKHGWTIVRFMSLNLMGDGTRGTRGSGFCKSCADVDRDNPPKGQKWKDVR